MSVKGWWNHKTEDQKTETTLKAAGGTALAVQGGRSGKVMRDAVKYQQLWTRPSGEKIKIKGANPKKPAYKNIKATTELLDKSLTPGTKVDAKAIKLTNLTGGIKGLYFNLGVTDRTKRGTIRLKKSSMNESPRRITNFLTKHTPLEVPDMTPQGLMTHEVGHSVAHARGIGFGRVVKANDTASYAANPLTGKLQNMWTLSKDGSPIDSFFETGIRMPSFDFGNDPVAKLHLRHTSSLYARTKPDEFFAESFRSQVAGRDSGLVRAKGGVMPAQKSNFILAKFFDQEPTKTEKAFMRKDAGVLRGTPARKVPKGHEFKDVNGFAQKHVDAMIVGGALAGAAGYGVYKYKTDKKFKRRVDTTVDKAKHYVKRNRTYGLEKPRENLAYGSNVIAYDMTKNMATSLAMDQLRTGKAEIGPGNVAAVGALVGSQGYLTYKEKKGDISKKEMHKDMMQGKAEFRRNARRKKGRLEKGALGAAALAGTAWGVKSFGKRGVGSSVGKKAAWAGTGAVLGAMAGYGTLESITSGVRDTRDLSRGRYKSTYGKSKAVAASIGAGGAIGGLTGMALKNKGLKGAGIGAGAAAGGLALYKGSSAYMRHRDKVKQKTYALQARKQYYTRRARVGTGRGRVVTQRIKNPGFGRARRRR